LITIEKYLVSLAYNPVKYIFINKNMRKGIVMLVISTIMKLGLSQNKGFIHYCHKGTDCVGLIPNSEGCMTRKNGEFQCFHIKKNKDLRHIKYGFNFDN
jgi:hypothetical protein